MAWQAALTAVKGFNWIRILLIAGIAVAIYGMGYMKSSAVHAKREQAQAEATSAEIARLSREHADKMRALVLAAVDKERQFNADLDEIKLHRDALIEQIEAAQLTKPAPEIVIEGCLEGDEDVQIVVANPFSDSFRLLWNQASRNLRPAGSEGADPE